MWYLLPSYPRHLHNIRFFHFFPHYCYHANIYIQINQNHSPYLTKVWNKKRTYIIQKNTTFLEWGHNFQIKQCALARTDPIIIGGKSTEFSLHKCPDFWTIHLLPTIRDGHLHMYYRMEEQLFSWDSAIWEIRSIKS